MRDSFVCSLDCRIHGESTIRFQWPLRLLRQYLLLPLLQCSCCNLLCSIHNLRTCLRIWLQTRMSKQHQRLCCSSFRLLCRSRLILCCMCLRSCSMQNLHLQEMSALHQSLLSSKVHRLWHSSWLLHHQLTSAWPLLCQHSRQARIRWMLSEAHPSAGRFRCRKM